MKKIFLITGIALVISIALSADSNDKAAVDFVKNLAKIAADNDNGYLNALRYFQYTATTAKNNPSSFILSTYGSSALKESGINASNKGKMIPLLKDRSGKRIKSLWDSNKNELLQIFPAESYNAILKNDVDSYIQFHDSPQFDKLMSKLKARNPVPDKSTIEKAGTISEWSNYREMAFWHRRIYEKNDVIVYSILKELKENYCR